MTISSLSQFEAMYKEHHARLCNLSYKIVGDRGASEDIVQDLFIKIWKKKDHLEINEVKNYLSKSTLNACINYLKSSKKNRLMTTLDHYTAPSVNSTEDDFNHSELQMKIDLAIKKLPAKCQTIFAMSRFKGMTSKEIATAMSISTKTVDNQIGIALSKLRKELKPHLIVSCVIVLLMLLLMSFFIR